MQDKIEPLGDTYIWNLLKEIPQPPDQLWIRGTLPPEGNKVVTIVGSRKCSEYGKQVVEEICQALKGRQVTIVSGLAIGIDTHAHECALKNNLHTIAVVGSGLRDEVIYPYQNRPLSKRIIVAGGALISENDPETESKLWMFPARNRLMVGMSQLVIIIEATKKSGTLITARLATDYNRDVMAVPASIYSSHSKGSNELIKQGAYMYTEPTDVLRVLGFDTPKEQMTLIYEYSETEKMVLDSIAHGNVFAHTIIEACSSTLSVSQIVQTLLNLEIEGRVKKMDGRYVKF